MADTKKRKVEDSTLALVVSSASSKKQKTAEIGAEKSQALIQVEEGVKRTSKLASPIMLLEGHEADILTMKFSPSGESLASGSRDKQIFLWNVYDDCKNYLAIQGHKNAVLEVAWASDNKKIYSASADKTVGIWDATTGRRTMRYTEHAGYVNAVCGQRNGTDNIASASDDGFVKIWDTRTRRSVHTINQGWPATAVALNDAHNQIFSGGIDNDIKVWDPRNLEQTLFDLKGHTDTITSLRVDPQGSYILSNSMDSTVRIWDIQPFAATQRCVKVFTGATHNAEKNLIKASWSRDGSYVAAGSADRMVYIWDTTTRIIKYRLPGHAGPVTEVDMHPLESIVGSCSIDRRIYLGEIEE